MRTYLPGLLFLSALSACGVGSEAERVIGELASDRIELSAEFPERVVAIEIDEGDVISAGQVILRQDDSRAQAVLAELDAIVGQAEARLAELKRGPRSEHIAQARANLEGAERELEFRRAEFTREQKVRERGLTSPEALDQAKAALDAAKANLSFRRAQLEEQLSGTTIEELEQAEQALRQAEARRLQASIDVQRHKITAPVDGLADTRLLEPGERPVVGQPVFIMLAGEQVHARVFVPEAMRVRLAPGTTATVHVDGLDTPLRGRLRWIASEPSFTPYYALTERDRGRLSYVAKVDILDANDRLPDGVPVEVVFDNDGAT